jgi:glycosyltransferase involved in cell wall biosynthesis
MSGSDVGGSPAQSAMQPRIWFLNRYFWPDYSATSLLMSDLAFRLARDGRAVGVICSRGRYDDVRASLPAFERRDGVEIHRVVQPRFGRGPLPGRAADSFAMYLGFAAALTRRARRGDIVVVKTDPPMLGAAIAPVARVLGLAQVNWLQDLYPEVALDLGVTALKPLAPLLLALRDWSLAGAVNVSVGERMADRVARRKVDSVVCIPNWCDEQTITPAREAGLSLRKSWGLKDEFVLGYCGNLGRAHEYETLLCAAERLRGRSDIVFLFVGGGHFVEALKAEAEKRGLSRAFRFEPYQPTDRLGAILSAPDAHWVSLRPEMEGLIVPSKFYSAAAAGRPVIAVCDPAGEIGALVRQRNCGIVAAPGDGQALAAAIATLADDAPLRERLGANARTTIEREYPRERALGAWSQRLAEVAEAAPARGARAPVAAPIAAVPLAAREARARVADAAPAVGSEPA